MNIWLIIQIVWEIFKLIIGMSKVDRQAVLARVKRAKQVAMDTGDTSELEKIRDELRGVRRA